MRKQTCNGYIQDIIDMAPWVSDDFSFKRTFRTSTPQIDGLWRVMVGSFGPPTSNTSNLSWVNDRLVERSLERFPSARLFVTYGPTEAAVDTTTFEASKVSDAAGFFIGHPDAFRIVDLFPDELCIAMGTGELRISGPGLAKGYLEGTGTASSAWADAPRAAGKRYASGDAVRWAKEGLEFLGRLDSQAACRTLFPILDCLL